MFFPIAPTCESFVIYLKSTTVRESQCFALSNIFYSLSFFASYRDYFAIFCIFIAVFLNEKAGFVEFNVSRFVKIENTKFSIINHYHH
jgi:hypothetical protein